MLINVIDKYVQNTGCTKIEILTCIYKLLINIFRIILFRSFFCHTFFIFDTSLYAEYHPII